MREWLYCFLLTLSLFPATARGAVGAYHTTPLDALEDTNSARALNLTNAALKRVSDDLYTLGAVILNKATRSVMFPSKVNMTEGPVEYAVVHSTGKVHESVLQTDADPLHIHLARLLVTPTVTNALPLDLKTPRDLRGPEVEITVEWDEGDKRFRVPLENLVTNTITRKRMTPGPWIYSGSRVVEGTYLAHRDGSIAAIIGDPDAMINNPRPGRDDDEIWRPNGALLPRVGTAVEVSIQPVAARE